MEQVKKTKDDVNYGPGMDRTRCDNCKYYHAKDDKHGACDKVAGIIRPQMRCRLFKAKS